MGFTLMYNRHWLKNEVLLEKDTAGNRIDLLNGKIAGALFWLSVPIMGTQFIEMAYNLFDTMWVGQIGNQAVTAVGVAGSFMWLGSGIAMIPQIGGQVMTGQSIGEGNLAKARRFAGTAIQLMLLFMTGYSLLCIFMYIIQASARIFLPASRSANRCNGCILPVDSFGRSYCNGIQLRNAGYPYRSRRQ